jgi:hypothetical protein
MNLPVNLAIDGSLLAELTLSPGGLIAWIGVGLIAGWLAGLVVSGAALESSPTSCWASWGRWSAAW